MNARESLVHAVYPEAEGPGTNELIDAYRAEVLAEAKTETVAWLVKKAAEQQTWDAAVLASKIDRGAVRAFIGTAHYRDAMDAFAAEVRTDALREAADKLALEMAPEQPGAGLGFLLALRLAMRAIRRMADEAASQ